MTFVIEYDRAKGTVERIEPFKNRREAAFLRLELSIRASVSGLDREIVTLDAASEAALRKTHRRYFVGVKDLANNAA